MNQNAIEALRKYRESNEKAPQKNPYEKVSGPFPNKDLANAALDILIVEESRA